jgi:hypothetical protein
MSERTWEAGTGIDQLDDLIEAHANEAVKYVFESDDTYGYFPVGWYPGDGGSPRADGSYQAPPDDPLTPNPSDTAPP